MRPIYGCPENFWEFLTTPTATFPEILMGLFAQQQIEVMEIALNLIYIVDETGDYMSPVDEA